VGPINILNQKKGLKPLMKVIITGHTRGIGKCLYEKFKSKGYEVIGFSRSNGYDIEDEVSRKIILKEAETSDIFVNNAYSSTAQLVLLNDIIAIWSGSSKYIINMNSKLSLFPLEKESDLDDYIKQKQSQNEIINDRIFLGSPRILNVIVGLVDTDMSKSFSGKKISPEQLASLVYDLCQYQEIQVQQIIVDVPGLDWKNIHRQKT